MLVVTPAKVPVVDGNFEAIEAYLRNWQQKVMVMDMTEDNMEEVRVIKKEAVLYRNSLTKLQGDVKRQYFNDPKAVFDAKMGKLLAVVGEVEQAADDVLAKEEQARLNDIDEVLASYWDKFQEQYKLDEDSLNCMEYKKQYYNKTVPAGYASMDKFWKEDLEAQFKELKKKQDARAANIRLITSACADDTRLNVKHWIDLLINTDVATILEWLTEEKQRLRDLDAEPEPASVSAGSSSVTYEVVNEDGEPSEDGKARIVLGVTDGIDFSSDFKGRNKNLTIKITYPCDMGDALTEVFKRLATYGITSKVLEEAY